MMFDCRGLGVALATPFDSEGALDLAALRQLVKHTAAGGASFVVALGSTGEAAMLADAEREQVIRTVVDAADGLPVVVGTGSSSTAQTCASTLRAQQLGARAALVVTPPYVKPTPLGIVAHFQAVAAAAKGLALIVYNVPSRTGTDLQPATLQQLWALPSVVAIKESSGNLTQIGRIAAELPRDKVLLAGDDNLALPTIASGGQGLVSVGANLVPRLFADLIAAARAGIAGKALELHQRLLPLTQALALESNPIPLKAGLQLLGLGTDTLRLPLTPPQPTTRDRMRTALLQLGAIPCATAN